jgi:thiamine-monophosphate kinase
MGKTKPRPGEFELIARYFRPLAAEAKGAFALTDDAAAFSVRPGEEVVITCDAIAEGVHFFPDDPPDSIAAKALRVNLSDLAAKGARPLAYLMALALPSDWTEGWLRKFAAGLAADGQKYGVALVGGDTIRASGGLTVAITAYGVLPKGQMVHRSGAKPGDAIFISGTIGDAALGLQLRRGRMARPLGGKLLLERYLRPEPRVALAPILRRHASAAIDVSDGLLGDLNHICEVSRVAADIAADAVPLSPPAAKLVTGDPAALPVILNGGDYYEILATVPARRAAAFAGEAAKSGVPVQRIGTIAAGKGPPVVRDRDGRPMATAGHSHVHF